MILVFIILYGKHKNHRIEFLRNTQIKCTVHRLWFLTNSKILGYPLQIGYNTYRVSA